MNKKHTFSKNYMDLKKERYFQKQKQNILKQLKFAQENVPYYKQKMQGLNLDKIKTYKDFCQMIPVLSQKEVIKNPRLFCSRLPIEFIRYSSSTMGTPKKVFLTKKDLKLWEEEGRISITPYFKKGMTIAHSKREEAYYLSSLQGAVEVSGGRLLTFDPTDKKDLINCVKQSDIIIDYAEMIHYIAEKISKLKTNLNKKLILVYTGNQLEERDITKIKAKLQKAGIDAEIYSEYATTEIGPIGCSENHNQNKFKIIYENIAFIEILHPEKQKPTEKGEIVITCLNRTGSVFIRYKIGDIGEISFNNEEIFFNLCKRKEGTKVASVFFSPDQMFRIIKKNLRQSVFCKINLNQNKSKSIINAKIFFEHPINSRIKRKTKRNLMSELEIIDDIGSTVELNLKFIHKFLQVSKIKKGFKFETKNQEEKWVVLGINNAFHESSAAIIVNGKLIAAVAEERFNRRKHGKEISVNNPHKLPLNAIEFCLKKAEVDYYQVNQWAFSVDPQLRLEKNLHWEDYDVKMVGKFISNLTKVYPPNSFGRTKGEKTFYNNLMKIPEKLIKKGAKINKKNFHWVSHHLSHAASAFYSSGFKDSAILVLDGAGEYETIWIAYGKKNKIVKVSGMVFPHSLGSLWSKLSKFAGLGYYGAGKLMGLAAYGNPSIYKKELNSLVQINNRGFEINEERVLAETDVYEGIEDLFKIIKRNSPLITHDPQFQIFADIAAALQQKTNEVLLELVKRVAKIFPSKNLCLAGGVFLNCVANKKIIDSCLFENVHICPAATDDGTAVGAALEIANKIKRVKNKKIKNWAIGPAYNEKEIKKALVESKITYTKQKNIHKIVANLLNKNKIIAWYQAGAEFGPRALGNRSLLANPKYNNKPKLNQIKKREDFRPLCPSILSEEVKNFFEVNKIFQPMYNMMVSVKIKTHFLEHFPSIFHPDHTSRIQIVTKENKLFYKLLKEFYKLSGNPMVINTSFNCQEPLVNSPTEAIKTFRKCKEIDALAIGDFLVRR